MPAPSHAAIRFHAPALPDIDGFLDDAREIVESGWLSDGRRVGALEARFAELCGAPVAVAVSNCSDGLIAALSTLVEPGTEVILPGYTYLATWQSVRWAGLTPVIADVDDQGLLDPAAVAAALTPRTGAILPVHLAGRPAPIHALRMIADRAGVPIIADAAHAAGARTASGPVGRDGDAEVFSIGATKQVGAGEGGLVTVRDPERGDQVRRFARQGHQPGGMDAIGPGMNLRLGELTAALAVRLLDGLEAQLRRREAIHDRYAAAWTDLPLRLSAAGPDERSAHKDQLVWVDDPRDRDPLRGHLATAGIETRPYYTVAVPDLTVFDGVVASADRSRALALRSFAVPIHPRLTDDEVDRIIAAVRAFYQGRW
ncbi:MAG: aminotransferase class I/II-fold pyridoxal phosphate-dependent enzyme [Chloroflexota bacterium]